MSTPTRPRPGKLTPPPAGPGKLSFSLGATTLSTGGPYHLLTVTSHFSTRDDLDSGRLICNCRAGTWVNECDHISACLREGKDAPLIRPDEDDCALRTIVVPMWKTDLLEVRVDVMHDGQVSLREIVKTIGFIEPSEGRTVVRDMVVEWLVAKYHTVACTSQYHHEPPFTSVVSIEEIRRRNNPRNPPAQLNTFSLLTTGECSSCADVGVPDLD